MAASSGFLLPYPFAVELVLPLQAHLTAARQKSTLRPDV